MDEKLTEIFGIDNKPLLELFRFLTYGIFIMLHIDADVAVVLQILMILDMITGVVKALRLKYPFEVKTMLWGFGIKVSLLIIPMTVALMAKGLGKDFLWMVDLCVKVLIVNEGFSVIANVLSIKQKKDIKNFDFISLLVESLTEFFVNKIKMYINGK